MTNRLSTAATATAGILLIVVTLASSPSFAGSRAMGTNPRAMGTNPRALGTNPRALGTNPRALGTNPRAVRERQGWDENKNPAPLPLPPSVHEGFSTVPGPGWKYERFKGAE
ncbi:hypothetical protein [Bradyrhizobium sp. UFLA05-112]